MVDLSRANCYISLPKGQSPSSHGFPVVSMVFPWSSYGFSETLAMDVLWEFFFDSARIPTSFHRISGTLERLKFSQKDMVLDGLDSKRKLSKME